jgi:hypothetical protein
MLKLLKAILEQVWEEIFLKEVERSADIEVVLSVEAM